MTTLDELMCAIKEGDLMRVRQARERGVDLTQFDKNRRRPLFLAIHFNRIDIVKELCTTETINLLNAEGVTPLWYAVGSCKKEIVDTLLSQDGIDLCMVNYHDCGTPLYLAAQIGELDIVKALLKMPAIDVDLGLGNDTPLIVAIHNRHSDVAIALINAGADVNYPDNATNRLPLELAVLFGTDTYKLVRALLRKGANPKAVINNRVRFFYYALLRSIPSTRLLIAAGVELYDLNKPHKPVIEDVLRSLCGVSNVQTIDFTDIVALLYVAFDNHELLMQSIQRVEDEIGKQDLFDGLREKLNDGGFVENAKRRLVDDKTEWIMHGLGSQNRILDVVMALKPMGLPTLVIIEILTFDNPRLSEIPYHIVWELVERIIRFTRA